MLDLVTPKQVAKAIGVSESSLKRWCDRGLLTSIRTAGGHRRIRVAEVLRYLRETGQEPVLPELLGLPPVTQGAGERSLAKARDQFVESLLRGDDASARQIGFDLIQSGRRISEISDDVLAPAFYEIGRLWGCGEVAIYQERRSCEIALRLVQELRRTIEVPRASAPKAIGGTLSGDMYALPTALVELTLRENGWNAVSLGCGLPVETLLQAAEDVKPRLLWVSVSHVENDARILDDLIRLRERLGRRCTVVVGGQKCPEPPVRPGLTRIETMKAFETFVPSLHPKTPGRRSVTED